MGQYYLPSLLKTNYKTSKQPIKKQLCAHRFCEGVKLMEHSWTNGYLMQAVEYMLSTNKRNPFVWAGDYAENLEGHNDNAYNLGDSLDLSDKILKHLPLVDEKSWLGMEHRLAPEAVKVYKYAINHSKKEYVAIPEANDEIHPLPLLTAESNGLGGGDYYGKAGMKYVGSWKYDVISVGNEVPKGYAKINPRFKECPSYR